MKKALPNFLLIGAAKSGTTSLFYYLKQHPDIYMSPIKEPAYFLFKDGINKTVIPKNLVSDKYYKARERNEFAQFNFQKYTELFEGSTSQKIIGEATIQYLMSPDSPKLIHEMIPDVKLLVILRNPYDAAYSEYKMTQNASEWNEDVSFMDLLKLEDVSDPHIWSLPNFIRGRLYYKQLLRYLELFRKDQILVVLYEDLENSQKLFDKIFEFLGITPEISIDVSARYNIHNKVKQRHHLNKLIVTAKLLKVAYFFKPFIPVRMKNYLGDFLVGKEKNSIVQSLKCPDSEKDFLRPYFNTEILKLQGLINRDLTHWLH
jgi:Sulfotransferase domain.